MNREALSRAMVALEGLSVGDAFGQCFFAMEPSEMSDRIGRREPPAPPWWHTDDTEMAIALVDVLARHGRVEQDDLATTFADRFSADPHRFYGEGTIRILSAVCAGGDWRTASTAVFGDGSMGNGSAMRVAPLGAYFCNDVGRLIEEARDSAIVTHAHDEAVAGAIAVSLAAAFAFKHSEQAATGTGREMLHFVLASTPPGLTRDGINCALEVSMDADVGEAAGILGNGDRITCPDTVPFCLWVAARHFRDFPAALWTAVSAGGDMDTTCAIAGGITACGSRLQAIPPHWRSARGDLPFGRHARGRRGESSGR